MRGRHVGVHDGMKPRGRLVKVDPTGDVVIEKGKKRFYG